MLVIHRSPINADNDDDHYEALVARQHEVDRKHNTLRKSFSIPIQVYGNH